MAARGHDWRKPDEALGAYVDNKDKALISMQGHNGKKEYESRPLLTFIVFIFNMVELGYYM